MDANEIRLFFEDGSDLAEAGATYSRETAEAGEQAAMARTAEELTLSQSAHDKQAVAQRGANALSDELARLRSEHEKHTQAYFVDAFFNADTVDHAQAAEESAKRTQRISGIAGALEFGRESLAPELRLNSFRADEALFRESAQLASWTALKSAVLRHQLAEPLADSEGAISFGNFGKTHDLLIAQLAAHRRAADASEMVLAEERSQRARKELL